MKRGLQPGGRDSLSMPYPWFWAVMKAWPVIIFTTGWFWPLYKMRTNYFVLSPQRWLMNKLRTQMTSFLFFCQNNFALYFIPRPTLLHIWHIVRKWWSIYQKICCIIIICTCFPLVVCKTVHQLPELWFDSPYKYQTLAEDDHFPAPDGHYDGKMNDKHRVTIYWFSSILVSVAEFNIFSLVFNLNNSQCQLLFETHFTSIIRNSSKKKHIKKLTSYVSNYQLPDTSMAQLMSAVNVISDERCFLFLK